MASWSCAQATRGRLQQQRGHVLIAGGCEGMGGPSWGRKPPCAVVRARTVATDPATLSGLLARVPEAMWVDALGADAEPTFLGDGCRQRVCWALVLARRLGPAVIGAQRTTTVW